MQIFQLGSTEEGKRERERENVRSSVCVCVCVSGSEQWQEIRNVLRNSPQTFRAYSLISV